MLKIKLRPNGKVHQRSYRIVVAEEHSKMNGKFTADLGFYTPQSKTLEINKEEMAKWIKNGAQTTLGVNKLLNPDKYPNKKKKVIAKTA
ncbi:MAG: 30S ribosomal protein S16 [Candidatus Shapirobacteria bacterium]